MVFHDFSCLFSGSRDKVKMTMFLPDDIFFEILSWLPVKALLRFKCVCKIWCSTIENPAFIHKHWKQSPRKYVYLEPGLTSNVVMQSKGIILELSLVDFYGYRLRNPATQQIVNLPDALGRGVGGRGVIRGMCYIPSTNELKVVFETFILQPRKAIETYNVLIVGKDFTWESIESPLLGGSTTANIYRVSRVIGTTFYSTRQFARDLYIDCLDLKNYNIKSIKTPLNSLSDGELVRIINWEGKPSLARIAQAQLIVHVLEDYKSHKWGDSKIVIPLTFLRNCTLTFLRNCTDTNKPVEKLFPYKVKGNLVHFRVTGSSSGIFLFNTQSEEVKYLTHRDTKLKYAYKPGLVPLHFKVKRLNQESLLSKFLRRCLCRA